jgi:hypothetical protein
MSFVFDDGGRQAAGYKGSTSDCITLAIAIATPSSWLPMGRRSRSRICELFAEPYGILLPLWSQNFWSHPRSSFCRAVAGSSASAHQSVSILLSARLASLPSRKCGIPRSRRLIPWGLSSLVRTGARGKTSAHVLEKRGLGDSWRQRERGEVVGRSARCWFFQCHSRFVDPSAAGALATNADYPRRSPHLLSGARVRGSGINRGDHQLDEPGSQTRLCRHHPLGKTASHTEHGASVGEMIQEDYSLCHP